MLDNFRKVYELLKGEQDAVKFTLIEDPVTIKITKGEVTALNIMTITKDDNGSIVLITRLHNCNIRQYEDFLIITNNNIESYILTNYTNENSI